MRSKQWLLALIAVVVLGFVYFWFSPYLALYGLQRAITTNNASAISRYVDLPKVRESLKSDLNRALIQEVGKDTTGFGALALAFVGPMIDQLVDIYITPEGLASIGTGEDPKKATDTQNVVHWRIKRRGLSEALVYFKDNPSEGLIMERQGLGWKVIRLQINLDQSR
ncbi:MAG: hypothetical protein C4327_11795 [Meiothermus sp.]